MFVNRVTELELLEKHYASGKAEFFVLYGRRRVGKTELLARFCEGKRSIFFVSDRVQNIAQDLSVGCSQYDFIWSQPNERRCIPPGKICSMHLPRLRKVSGW